MLGPAIGIFKSAKSNVSVFSTWKATGSAIFSTTHNSVFKSNWGGRGEYSLINIVGLAGSLSSN